MLTTINLRRYLSPGAYIVDAKVKEAGITEKMVVKD
jgi:hypothetical protein